MSDETTVTTPPPPPPLRHAAREERPRPRRRGLLFPLVLTAVGALFLAANLGYLPAFSARAFFQLWPVLLILAGIEIALGRREPYAALAIEVLVIAAAIGLLLSQPLGIFAPVGGTSDATVARGTSTSLSLRVEGGAGTYTIRGGATALVEAHARGGDLRVDDDRGGGGTASIRVRPNDMDGLGSGTPQDVDVVVASDVPTSLRVSGGAGDFTVDMSAMRIKEARVETGAAKVEVTLPKPTGDVPIRIAGGAASFVVTLPDGVEARFTTSGGLLSQTVQNARLSDAPLSGVAVERHSIETAGYATATDRLTVTIEAGASSVTIR